MDTRARILSVLGETPEVVFARLFGSRASGTAHARSDWDVAVYLRDDLGPERRFDLRRAMAASLNGPSLPRVDLTVLNDAPPLLAHRALRGEELLNRDRATFVRYFVRIMGEADDERWFRRVHERARRARLEEDRFGRP